VRTSKSWSARTRRGLLYTVLTLGAVAMVTPFIWMLLTSFKTPAEIDTSVPNPPAETEAEDFDWPNTRFEVVRTPIDQHIIAINRLGELLPHTATIDPSRDRGKLPECEPVIVDWDAILTGKADL
jgi:ABC-type glycerol-3-phosphate transport system permease component